MSIGLLIVGIAAAKGVRTMDTATARLRTTSIAKILFILFSPFSIFSARKNYRDAVFNACGTMFQSTLLSEKCSVTLASAADSSSGLLEVQFL
jgi:hypothetical protein